MNRDNINPQIIGAFLLGIAIVATAYLAGNFGRPSGMFNKTETAAVNTSDLEVREPIQVVDADNNGIEDWRDALLTTQPIVTAATIDTTGPYVPPETLTGKVGIELIEKLLTARTAGYAAKPDEEIAAGVVEDLYDTVSYDLYNYNDIIVLEDSDVAIKVYANEAALILQSYGGTGENNVGSIFRDYQNSGDINELEKIDIVKEDIDKLHAKYLKTPVPESLVEAHLDLINILKALVTDLEMFKQSPDDPLKTFVHIQYYDTNVKGFAVALQNMALALEPHSKLFTANDPAFLFVFFHPNFEQ